MKDFLEFAIPLGFLIISLGILIINTSNIISIVNGSQGNIIIASIIHVIISTIFIESANILDRGGV